MPRLPERPNIEDLKKQAKDLLLLYQAGELTSYARFRASLPEAQGKDDAGIAALELKLHDAQSCVAREYGLPSWQNLQNYADWANSRFSPHRQDAVPLWLHDVYGHQTDRPRPALAAQKLAVRPDLGQGELFLACASGDEAAIRSAIADDPACVNRLTRNWQCPGCKELLDMPPLVAVTHSTLMQLPDNRDRFHRCARMLLEAGADANQAWSHGAHPLSALYGAAGKNHDAVLTRILLEAGADPNDGESLYHSTEARDPACTRLLLQAGANVERSNALVHKLDTDDLEGLNLLLDYLQNDASTASVLNEALLWALRRRRSREHIEALLKAGADPRSKNKDGTGAHLLALRYGLTDVAEALQQAGGSEALALEDSFVAACARGDEPEARRILFAQPDIFVRLSEIQLRQLPELAEGRGVEAVKLMVRLGWPIAVRGGDWSASALNLAVLQGDSGLARFLLEHGARWTERHAFDGDVYGTLCWASRNNDSGSGDWVGCARALVEHGMPTDLQGDPSPEVAEFLAAQRASS